MKTIVLTGMMGSGKTSVGKVLAQVCKVKFIDLDNYIEQSTEKKIADIFEVEGEAYFRKLEKNALKEVFSSQDLVISLGGGAFENLESQNFLLSNSTVVYLKTDAVSIFNRIKNDTTRPLLANNLTKEFIANLISLRAVNYEKSHYQVITDNKTIETIVDEILGAVKNE